MPRIKVEPQNEDGAHSSRNRPYEVNISRFFGPKRGLKTGPIIAVRFGIGCPEAKFA